MFTLTCSGCVDLPPGAPLPLIIFNTYAVFPRSFPGSDLPVTPGLDLASGGLNSPPPSSRQLSVQLYMIIYDG